MDTLEEALKNLPLLRPPAHLRKAVLARIRAEAVHRPIRLYLFGGLSFIFGLSFLPAAWYAVTAIATSPFGSYLSLFVTDTGAALSHWQSLTLSLAETAPLFELTLALSAVFAFLFSARAFASELPARLTHRVHAA
jgi:hypothetical protein